MIGRLGTLFSVACVVCMSPAVSAEEQKAKDRYGDLVRADGPAAWWRFEETKARKTANWGDRDRWGTKLDGTLVGRAKPGQPGPRHERYPLFWERNSAIRIDSGSGYVRVQDPGKNSPLDFTAGDAITLEAWVNPVSARSGGFAYVVGKGRTHRDGFPRDNQNYALRLKGAGGQAQITFLFRDSRNRAGKSEDYHRWTSDASFPLDSGWHHVAVTYSFGKKDSLRGYIDGQPVRGKWDMGGKTDRGPVVDDDELWIGSAMGGNPGSTFRGGIDEVAIYRKPLSPERIRLRYKAIKPKPYVTKLPLPEDGVLVEIIEKIPGLFSPPVNHRGQTWDFIPQKPTLRYVEPVFGFNRLPQKYSERGLRVQWSNPFLVRMTGLVKLPKGELQLLIRSRSAARLFIDGRRIVTNPFHNVGGGGHSPIKDTRKIKEPHIRTLQPGDTESLATFTGDGKTHRVTFEIIIGGNNKRAEPGETAATFRPAKSTQPFVVMSPKRPVTLTLESWLDHLEARRDALIELNAKNRRKKSANVAAEWKQRHERVRRWLKSQPAVKVPDVSKSVKTNNAIDRFIAAELIKAGEKPAELTNDYEFLRRVTLDVIGTVPTPKQIAEFFNDTSPNRRARYIDRLLQHPGWADHWVSYWQDVLAENPNILKPTLNNTGPFRFWIYESLLDNKPMDRFATELLTMRGDKYVGAPAGFEMAAQNDVPMAAKAHVVGQAFLAVQMKCARCHDAPFHDLKQKDLFSLAAMLKRGPQPVPKSSSVPLSKEALDDLIVQVTLQPGSKVKPQWPFPEIAPRKLPPEFAADSPDTRRQLAAYITAPQNTRFAKVIVNRIWARYLGRGIVEPVDDWETAEPSHPELLDWLAREFLHSGYDQKHVARLILNSRTYQRKAVSRNFNSPNTRYLFAAPLRRRMTAEQIVDSLFTAAGKRLNAGLLNMDVDGARPYKQFINLGRPRRAWEFASLSNERDRPSLAMPYAQDFVSLLKVFGWRAARQNPQTKRDHDPTVLQAAILANGIVGRRITRLSDDSALTELAVQKQPVEQLVRKVFLRMLTRPPTTEESQMFSQLLADGYDERVIPVDPAKVKRRFKRPTGVSWSNHLRPEANVLKMKMEKLVQQGDPPSVRLKKDWRQSMEDMIWALMNSPEFVFSP